MNCPNCGTEINSVEQWPSKYKPLAAWAYFGLQILFAIPVIGFIFLIIFTFNGSNINRRSFARSYWCVWLIGLIAISVLAATGALSAILSSI